MGSESLQRYSTMVQDKKKFLNDFDPFFSMFGNSACRVPIYIEGISSETT